MTTSLDEHRKRFLEAMKRAEEIAEKMARDACAAAAKGREADLETARMAMEAHRRAKELRERSETELSQPSKAD